MILCLSLINYVDTNEWSSGINYGEYIVVSFPNLFAKILSWFGFTLEIHTQKFPEFPFPFISLRFFLLFFSFIFPFYFLSFIFLFSSLYLFFFNLSFQYFSFCFHHCLPFLYSLLSPFLLLIFPFNPYPIAFPYGNGMFLHFYQQQESSTTKTVHRVINKGLKTYV